MTAPDANSSGVSAPYMDARLDVDARVEDLVGRLSLEEKAGLMFQRVTPVPSSGSMSDDTPRDGQHGIEEILGDKYVNHLNVHVLPDPAQTAAWVNEVQQYARTRTPHGIPVTIATDPRHSFAENFGASFTADNFSAWPEPLGFAALGDEDVVRVFARIARDEYRAVGLRAALHPTIDLATEPRWARQYGTFGQDADLTARLAKAYLDGFEGAELGSESVACMAKHFPGGGPQRDGEDPHYPYGREQVYPGGAFEEHLRPFREIIRRGVSAIMPYYGMPIGLVRNGESVESVGFGFNRQIITGILREELGYDGVVCTDWGLITESHLAGRSLPARAWGVEHLSKKERMAKVVEAGCDQFGGEESPEVIVELVREGTIREERIDQSVRRLLRVKFALGLFDDPFVDEARADARVGTDEARALGRRTQARSVTVLENDGAAAGRDALLPLRPETSVFAEGISEDDIEAAGLRAVSSPEAADVVLVRLSAPYQPRDQYMLEASFHAGSLEFDEAVILRLADLAAFAPVVVAVHLDRPAVLTPLVPLASALVGVYGTSDAALLEALTGRIMPEGRLPFDLPRSMADVEASMPDVAGGFEKLYGFGHRVPLRNGAEEEPMSR
ncbi:glycoside hydrolase family 3 protein [Microbacterium halotolerans]|uniref:glycoside hydrolase family 3 protein n=1 Tax=Microbacterium halotolerans TaxID=246613 RepID=UPI000E6AACC9|nr:glycoside hydrolase family 3 N-terminal domain-containing protein [Microbacterium halotolerans]